MMLTDDDKKHLGGQYRREHLCAIRFDVRVMAVPIKGRWPWSRKRWEHHIQLAPFLRFEITPDTDTFYLGEYDVIDSGEILIHLPQPIATIS
jgi:hypothetical protein